MSAHILGIPEVGEKQWAEKEEERRAKVSVNNGQRTHTVWTKRPF